QVMAARGIDIADRESKSLTRFVRNRFDRVITLCDKVREICPELPGAARAAHWSIADPSLDDGFEQVADEIESRVTLLLAELGVPVVEGATRV
ncbi:MAG TPA: hypothetical protein VEA78_02095, partial [Acidimicrobiales bacterium]|nr:hypothetical protein [Acidimicrobiales bacterium]